MAIQTISQAQVVDSDVILMQDYEVSCIIGILPSERTTKQRLLISFELHCAPNLPEEDFDLTGSINYAEAALLLADLAQSTKAGTVEYLGRLMVDTLFSHYGEALKHVVLTLKKPDIIKEAQFVGIRISRSNPGVSHA